MVRLSDALTPTEGSKPPGEDKQLTGESLPEVTILTKSQEVVNLVRRAVEERGYRIHHALTPDQLLTRLKAVGRVLLVVDGNIEGVGELLLDPALSDRPLLLLAKQDQVASDLFPKLAKSQILTYPVNPAALLTSIQNLPGTDRPQDKAARGRIFSSLPGQPPATQAAAGEAALEPEGTRQRTEKPAPPSPLKPPPRPLGEAARISELIPPIPPPSVEKGEPPAPAITEEPAEIDRPISEVQLKEFEEAKSKAYEVAVDAVQQFMNGHRTHSNPPLGSVAHAVEDVIREMEVSKNLFLEVIHHTPLFDDVDQYLAHHHVNVTSLTITIGKGLKLPPKELFELALATVVHDVGETQLPDGLILRRGRLDQSGYSQVKQHPAYGKQLLQDYAHAYPWLPDVVYQEHERYDGSGYPEEMSGDDIHLYARIIGLADTYEALTHSRPFREKMIPFNVLQQLIRLGGRLFHSELVKTLIDQISVFPLGSNVRLNTGEIGKVVHTNEGYPLRPVLQILFASDGSPLEQGRSLDLKAEPMLYITGPAEAQE